MKQLERSFVVIKPDGTARRRVSALVIKALLDRGYKVRAFKEMKVSKSLAEMHYAVHREKPFFSWLVDFITSANILAMILEADNVIEGVREALGATFVQNASPDSLRGRYGIWAGINIAHASDGLDTARTEISLWKTEGEVEESDDAEASAWAYISKYSSGSADYTMDIRNTVKESIENRNTSPSVLSSLENLLGKDANGIEEKSISALAKAIFDYIKEEVEKK